VSTSFDAVETDPLIGLLRQCVVRVENSEQGFRGTGFFIAPDCVVTCAHVVHGAVGLRVAWQEHETGVSTVEAVPPLDAVADPAEYPLPDLAVLGLRAIRSLRAIPVSACRRPHPF
jgi:hypothetical protein